MVGVRPVVVVIMVLGAATLVACESPDPPAATTSKHAQHTPLPPSHIRTPSRIKTCLARHCSVQPGQAGFVGDRSALIVVPDQTVPAGCTWDGQLKYLECRDNAVISNMFVKGGIDAYANLTISNSVVSANPTNWVMKYGFPNPLNPNMDPLACAATMPRRSRVPAWITTPTTASTIGSS